METITHIMADGADAPSSFAEYLDRYADKVGDLINQYIPRGSHPDMNRYLYDPITRYSQNAGKRLRPLACFAACKAVGGNMDAATSAAAAIEHFHSAALIHDDIADDAELRRGMPCLHLTEGLGLAINMGDLGLMLVNGTVIWDPLLDDTMKVRVMSELLDMARSTIEGQALDIGWARDERYDLSMQDYLDMATCKTAYYSCATPLAVGAIVGGAPDEQVEQLRAYGLAVGLAFQIQDDLLNLVGTEEAKRKDFRSDITEGKRTLVVVHALQHSAKRERLIDILSSKEKDEAVLEEAVAIMRESGSIDYARDYALQLTEKAKAQLRAALEPSDTRDLLCSMADWFVNRLA